MADRRPRDRLLGRSPSFRGLTGGGAPAANGVSARLPNGQPKLSANDLGVIPQDQGNTNACGTTSLANVMTHWGKPPTHDQIDNDIRAFDMFTAPDKLVEYARANGMRASLKADANRERHREHDRPGRAPDRADRSGRATTTPPCTT